MECSVQQYHVSPTERAQNPKKVRKLTFLFFFSVFFPYPSIDRSKVNEIETCRGSRKCSGVSFLVVCDIIEPETNGILDGVFDAPACGMEVLYISACSHKK